MNRSFFLRNTINTFAIVLLMFTVHGEVCHDIPDSIANLSYEEYEKYFEKYEIDTTIDFIYAQDYLQKARMERDTLRMANSFFQFSKRYKDSRFLHYADSIFIYKKKIFTLKGHI